MIKDQEKGFAQPARCLSQLELTKKDFLNVTHDKLFLNEKRIMNKLKSI